jgi:thiol-disulfide isomerase/thioredoxin
MSRKNRRGRDTPPRKTPTERRLGGIPRVIGLAGRLILSVNSESPFGPATIGRQSIDRATILGGRDAEGRFRFLPQEGACSVIVLHDSGFAERTAAQLAGDADVVVRPWGRVEGTLRIGPRPGAGERVKLFPERPEEPDQPHPYFDYQGTTDADGRFVIDRVLPGSASVSRVIPLGERSTGYSHNVPVEVEAGRTARVNLGGTGRPVVGRVVVPEGAGTPVDLSHGFHSLSLKRAKVTPPEGLDEAQTNQWYRAWNDSEEGRAYRRSRRDYAVKVEPDGSFRVDDMPAGTYQLTISVHEPPIGTQCGLGTNRLGSTRREFTVPEMAGGRGDEPLDLGTIELTLAKRLKVGDLAPAFRVETLGDDPLTLEDYRGKFVLLDFWATWCGPCVAETPHLKATHEAFGKDERFAMIGLSLDKERDAPQTYVTEHGLGWTQGFLGDFSQAKLPEEYGVRGIPSIWLIGPDGKIFAKDLRGAAIQEAVARALGRP